MYPDNLEKYQENLGEDRPYGDGDGVHNMLCGSCSNLCCTTASGEDYDKNEHTMYHKIINHEDNFLLPLKVFHIMNKKFVSFY